MLFSLQLKLLRLVVLQYLPAVPLVFQLKISVGQDKGKQIESLMMISIQSLPLRDHLSSPSKIFPSVTRGFMSVMLLSTTTNHVRLVAISKHYVSMAYD